MKLLPRTGDIRERVPRSITAAQIKKLLEAKYRCPLCKETIDVSVAGKTEIGSETYAIYMWRCPKPRCPNLLWTSARQPELKEIKEVKSK